MPDEEKGFVIKDRRHFTEKGEARGETETKAEPVSDDKPPSAGQPEKGPEARPEATESAQGKQPGAGASADTRPMPEIDFSTFVFSLASSALLHLGEIPDPVTNQQSVNLPLAKQTIDILGMLKEKTEGNLENEERDLLKNLLYELRMKYVTATKG